MGISIQTNEQGSEKTKTKMHVSLQSSPSAFLVKIKCSRVEFIFQNSLLITQSLLCTLPAHNISDPPTHQVLCLLFLDSAEWTMVPTGHAPAAGYRPHPGAADSPAVQPLQTKQEAISIIEDMT